MIANRPATSMEQTVERAGTAQQVSADVAPVEAVYQRIAWRILPFLTLLFVMAWQGYGVWALVTTYLARAIAGLAVVFWYERWLPGLAIGLQRARAILSFSIGAFGARALWTTYDQADAIVLGKMTDESTLGFYTMARDLASLPTAKVSVIVNRVAVPVMAELQDDRASMRNTLLRGVPNM